MQNFIPIGGTVDEIFVPGQTKNYSKRYIRQIALLALRLSDNKQISAALCCLVSTKKWQENVHNVQLHGVLSPKRLTTKHV